MRNPKPGVERGHALPARHRGLLNAMVGRLVSVGVYGFTAERFLVALEQAKVDVLLEVRQRRGVRGPEYTWANSRRLQQALTEHGIAYEHLKELAPTSEIRAGQYAADAAAGESKRADGTQR
jgi:uncharacterized protein (DUF488 family)